MAMMAELVARGFDRCKHVGVGKGIRVGCSQCQAICVNGVACHETGCPNAVKECLGCNERIPARPSLHYCEDCR